MTKRFVITGASAGIGRELARVFAAQGMQVGLAVRDVVRGAAQQKELGPNTDVLACDLASMPSVQALADGLIRSGRPVDVLMLNAGVYGQPFALTSDGLERTFAANCLGHFLLVHRLLEARAFAPQARIVVTQTTSITRWFVKANLEMLTAPDPKKFSATMASPSAKVLLALLGHALTRRAAGAILWVGVSPGGVRTGNVDQTPALLRPLLRALLKPVEEGVEPLVWAATADGLVSGTVYGRDHRPIALNADASNLELAERVWTTCEQVLKLPPWPTA